MWFTEFGANQIGRIPTVGLPVTHFGPTGAGPSGITFGADGALWFTMTGDDKIGRMTTSGSVTEYTIPTPNSEPGDIVAGPDGALWFTEFVGQQHRADRGRRGCFTAASPFIHTGDDPHTQVVEVEGGLPCPEATGPDGAQGAEKAAPRRLPLPPAREREGGLQPAAGRRAHADEGPREGQAQAACPLAGPSCSSQPRCPIPRPAIDRAGGGFENRVGKGGFATQGACSVANEPSVRDSYAAPWSIGGDRRTLARGDRFHAWHGARFSGRCATRHAFAGDRDLSLRSRDTSPPGAVADADNALPLPPGFPGQGHARAGPRRRLNNVVGNYS